MVSNIITDAVEQYTRCCNKKCCDGVSASIRLYGVQYYKSAGILLAETLNMGSYPPAVTSPEMIALVYRDLLIESYKRAFEISGCTYVSPDVQSKNMGMYALNKK